MLLTLETSHSPIGPFAIHLPNLGDDSRHALMVLFSSILDCGEKAGMGRNEVGQERNNSGLDTCKQNYDKVSLI